MWNARWERILGYQLARIWDAGATLNRPYMLTAIEGGGVMATGTVYVGDFGRIK
jgi:hypothetical protein